jgi:hypothetical protein
VYKKNWVILKVDCVVYKNELLELNKTTKGIFETNDYKEALTYFENKVSKNGTTNGNDLVHLVGIKIYKLILTQEQRLLFNRKQRKFKTLDCKYYW